MKQRREEIKWMNLCKYTWFLTWAIDLDWCSKTMDIKALDFFLNRYRKSISVRNFADFFLQAGFRTASMTLQNGRKSRKPQHSGSKKVLLTNMFILPRKLEISNFMWSILIFKYCRQNKTKQNNRTDRSPKQIYEPNI